MKKLIPIILLCILTVGCKPTEKNYQQAYELARQKKESATENFSDGKLESIDGPHQHVVGNDTIMVGGANVRIHEDSPTPGEGRIGIAVAAYGMHTNATRHAEELRKKYPQAFVAVDGNKKYYVIIQRTPSMKEAAAIIRDFKDSHPGYNYIGLPDSPVTTVIYNY